MENDVKITRKSRNYEILFLDGDVFKCSVKLAKDVSKNIPGVNPEEIAPILARLKTKSFKNDRMSKMRIDSENIGRVLGVLLETSGNDFERVREMIETLTVQETEQLFNAEDPLEVWESF